MGYITVEESPRAIIAERLARGESRRPDLVTFAPPQHVLRVLAESGPEPSPIHLAAGRPERMRQVPNENRKR